MLFSYAGRCVHHLSPYSSLLGLSGQRIRTKKWSLAKVERSGLLKSFRDNGGGTYIISCFSDDLVAVEGRKGNEGISEYHVVSSTGGNRASGPKRGAQCVPCCP